MPPLFQNILLFGFIAAVATMAGAYLVLLNQKRAKAYVLYIIAASAGGLLGATFLHLLPEALELNRYALSFTLLSFLCFYLIEQLVVVHPCDEPHCDTHKLKVGRMSLLAFAVHSLLDGMAVAVGFSINPFLGLVSAVAVILHELPEGISTVTLLIYADYPPKKALRMSAIVAFATPVGAVLTYFLLPYVTGPIQGGLLGLVAGSFLYVAAADIIPETHRAGNRKTFVFMLLGLAFLILVTKFFE